MSSSSEFDTTSGGNGFSMVNYLSQEWMAPFKSALQGGDPVVKSWFLVRHQKMPFILCLAYTLFVFVVGPLYMRNRKPYKLRSAMIIFNFALVITYASVVYVVATNLPILGFDKFCKGVPLADDELAYKLVSWLWVVYIMKYVEFLDTVFFVLRKKSKQVTHLHVFHHSIVPLAGWVLLNRESSGFLTIPILLNSAIHVIMYSYYGLAAIGPHMQKYLWWKKYITVLQMIQFILIVVWMVIFSRIMGCPLVATWLWLDVTILLYLLYLFYRFYRNVYNKKISKTA